MAFKRRGFLLILSSPSGTGKTTITRALLERLNTLSLSRSTTTRAKRPGELDGTHYDFTAIELFKKQIEAGIFLEYAEVFGHCYGTPLAPVQSALRAGKDILFDIDWQGAAQIRKKMPHDVVSIFLLPPSVEALEKRLKDRAQDSDSEIQKRIKASVDELEQWEAYDYLLVNDDLETTIDKVEAILIAEAQKQTRQKGASDFIELLQTQVLKP